MSLPTYSFQQIVNAQIAAIRANSSQLIDFSPGSVLLSIVEANAANAMWMQGLINALLGVTRLTTSHGNDVLTFVQDFGYTPPDAVAASGLVTFSRTITTNASYIPADGSVLVKTSSTQVVFRVILDTTNPNYDPVTNSYVMNVSVSSINVPVQAVIAGVSGNVLAGQIDTIISPLTNVTGVTNGSNFTNGANAPNDDQIKIDFVLYLQGLFRATLQAIESAVANVPGVVRYNVVENQSYPSNATQLGYFYVIVDDGTGSPPGSLITNVTNAVEAVRGLCIQYGVFAPTPVSLTMSMSVLINNQITQTQARTDIRNAIVSYIQNLQIGAFLPYSKVIEIIYDSAASPNILNVTNLLINGSTMDIVLTSIEVFTIVASDITVNFL